MREPIRKILITGGAGFIGSEFVRVIARAKPEAISLVIIDNLTYAGDLGRLKEVFSKYKFYKADISNQKQIEAIFKSQLPDIVVHFAAETHVDRSIVSAGPFIESNVKGTQVLLDAAKKYGIVKFFHISTDEVYGDIKKGKFTENSSLSPNSPYAASKAAADLLVKAYIRTYNFPAIIIRACNNYGPWQYPEKLIPLTILNIMREKKTPVYAKGENVREWMHVSDTAAAILKIMQRGRIGQVYNIGTGNEHKNIEVVKRIIRILGKSENLIEYVKDRPGHDFRYALDTKKMKKDIGWQPKINFLQGLERTVNWYITNLSWTQKHFAKKLSVKF